MGRPGRFPTGAGVQVLHRASRPGLARPANTDRKGQPMSKAGSVPAADHPDPGRRHRPQAGPPARQDLLHADGRTRRRAPQSLCVVAGALAERGWAVMNRQMPYVICDTDGTPVTPEQAKQIIARELDRPRRGPQPPPQPQDAAETGQQHHQRKGEGPSASRTRRHDKSHDTRRAWTNEATFPPMILRGNRHTVNPQGSGLGLRAPIGQAPGLPDNACPGPAEAPGSRAAAGPSRSDAQHP